MATGAPRLTSRIIVLIAALLACGVIGYFVGRSSRSPQFVVGPGWALWSPGGGTAWQGGSEVANHPPSGFAYSLPVYVPWIDSAGTLHESNSRPSCLRLSRIIPVTSMETVKYPIAGGYSGTVLWVQC